MSFSIRLRIGSFGAPSFRPAPWKQVLRPWLSVQQAKATDARNSDRPSVVDHPGAPSVPREIRSLTSRNGFASAVGPRQKRCEQLRGIADRAKAEWNEWGRCVDRTTRLE